MPAFNRGNRMEFVKCLLTGLAVMASALIVTAGTAMAVLLLWALYAEYDALAFFPLFAIAALLGWAVRKAGQWHG